MHVGAQTNPGHAAHRDSIQLIPRGLGIPAPAAASQCYVRPDITHDLHPRPAAETLEQRLSQQARSDQLRVESWNVAKVSMVEVEFQALHGLHPNREETAADAGAWGGDDRIPARTVGLQRVIDREVSLVEDSILEEHERPIDAPLQQVDSHAGSAGVANVVEGATLKIYEGAA